MWDNPRQLNAIANGLFALVLVLVLGAGLRLVVQSPLFLLRSIQIEGELAHVGRAEVVKALQGRLAGTFFNMDLDAVRVLFETIPWVRRTEVRRMWPDRLVVRMEEHVPFARWGQPGENRMVNTYGEVFSAPYAPPSASAGKAGDANTDAAGVLPALPQLSGPAGSAREVAQRYAAFAAMIAPLNMRLEAVMLSPRYSWQLKLSNGLSVQLGREAHEKDKLGRDTPGVDARLERFVAVYPRTLAPLSRRLDYVDLRYANGFALRVPGLKDAALPSTSPGRPTDPKAQRKTPA